MIVDGQVHGGVAQGIAQALFEEAVYDADGNLVTGTLADYLVPAASDLPSITTDRTEPRRRPTRSASRASARRARSPRRRRSSTPSSTRSPARRVTTSRCRARRNGLAGHPGRQGRRAEGTIARRPQTARRREVRHDPRGVRLRPGRVGRPRASALAEHGDDAKVMAGGQSLLPLMRLRLAAPSVLVDFGRLADLRVVRDAGDALVIGAPTTHHEVMNDRWSGSTRRRWRKATATVADPAVRHRGTFGGSLAHADPAGDLPAMALALGAEMVVAGPERPAGDPGGGVLRRLPRDRAVAGRAAHRGPDAEARRRLGLPLQKFHRSAQAWAIVGRRRGGAPGQRSIAEARIGLTNMGATPVRAEAAEEALAGVDASDDAGLPRRPTAADGTRRRATWPARPTTASISPGSSPAARMARGPAVVGPRKHLAHEFVVPEPDSRHGRRCSTSSASRRACPARPSTRCTTTTFAGERGPVHRVDGRAGQARRDALDVEQHLPCLLYRLPNDELMLQMHCASRLQPGRAPDGPAGEDPGEMLAVVGPAGQVARRRSAVRRAVGRPGERGIVRRVHPDSACSAASARTGVAPMFVSPIRASAIEPLSRRTAAATPTIAHACATRCSFS